MIIPSPYYENYWADCVLTGAVPRFVSLRPPDWRIDLDELMMADGLAKQQRRGVDHVGRLQVRHEVDRLVVLRQPQPFRAVGLHYADFEQTRDAEVIALLG